MFVCIRLRTKKTPFDVLVFTLPSKVNLIWTRAIRPVIAQSAQFGEIAFSQIHFSEARAQWSTMGKKIWLWRSVRPPVHTPQVSRCQMSQ